MQARRVREPTRKWRGSLFKKETIRTERPMRRENERGRRSGVEPERRRARAARTRSCSAQKRRRWRSRGRARYRGDRQDTKRSIGSVILHRSLQKSGDARQRVVPQAETRRCEDKAVSVLAEGEVERNSELVRRPSRVGPEIHSVWEVVFEDPKSRRSLSVDEEGDERIASLSQRQGRLTSSSSEEEERDARSRCRHTHRRGSRQSYRTQPKTGRGACEARLWSLSPQILF